MEWGPRALGNRSILCDPRRADMKADPEREDQAPRIVPAVRALNPRRGRGDWFEERRRRSVHDAGLSDPGGQARAHPRGDPRRWLGTAADGLRAAPIHSISS